MTRHLAPSSVAADAATPRTRGRDRQGGSVTLFLAVATTGLLVMVGLVVDGGAKIRAAQRADTAAAEAARAAGNQLARADTLAAGPPRVDPRAAAAAGRGYLAAAGVTGDVAVDPAAATLTVTTTAEADTVFLTLIGVRTVTAHGHATVSLVRGSTGAHP